MSHSPRVPARFAATSCVVPALAVALLLGCPLAARAQATTPTAPGAPAAFATAKGTVTDSIHGGNPLAHALVRVDSAGREAFTDENGAFEIDSIRPGQHRLVIIHPMLDTLGISLVSPVQTYAAGAVQEIDLAIPPSDRMVNLFCAPAWRARGPAALVGFVRDPDTQGPATGAKVSLLYYESDPLGLTHTPRVREATPGPDGHYRICGLPADMSGKVQVFRGGLSSGEVPAVVKDGFLAMRSLSVASRASVQIAKGKPDSAGKTGTTIVRGHARVSGRVVNKSGQGVAGARVDVEGIAAAAITKSNGEFTLDSLPSGTQTLEVRKLGFSVTDHPVELSAEEPQRVTIQMADYVPTLETVRVQARRDRNLFDVGFTERQKMGMGYYLTRDKLNTNALRLTDALRTIPGIRIQTDNATGQNIITSSRDPNGGCVNVFVDGSPWQQMEPGDLDSFVKADELGAIESYGPTTVPAQFTVPGQGSCQTLVIWTERRLNRGGGK